ncbi:calcium/sodium antiporter [Terrisporobacter sp.]
MSFIFLLIGFFFLIKGADFFVEGAVSIARKFNVPSMIIGLTIVAMGTSAPEAAVSITSSLAGQNDMSVANVVGSNFFNILIVLGISSILKNLPVQKNTINKDTPLLIISCALLLLFSFNLNINRIEGLVFLAFFVYFSITTIKNAKKNNNESTNEAATTAELEIKDDMSIFKTILFSIIGIIGIVLGGDMVVDSATKIATTFGMSANLIGLTIVALGTSLPEFVTSVIATKKGETEIAIGNIIGSNIFNILLILGLAASITPITISMFAFIDIIFMTFITLLLFLFIKKNNSLSKVQGYIFVIIYIAYMTYTIIR